jgi:hypothetical protein
VFVFVLLRFFFFSSLFLRILGVSLRFAYILFNIYKCQSFLVALASVGVWFHDNTAASFLHAASSWLHWPRLVFGPMTTLPLHSFMLLLPGCTDLGSWLHWPRLVFGPMTTPRFIPSCCFFLVALATVGVWSHDNAAASFLHAAPSWLH